MSVLITIDLADYAPEQSVLNFDLKDFLFKGIVLKEKEFRNSLAEFDFSIYANKVVALFCSSDAIVPMWAFTKEEVFQKIFTNNINAINTSEFEGKKVIVKGCGQIPLTEPLYIAITKKLQNTVSSLMFGEACSAVPVFKKK